jgi:hypothetical protein
VDVVAFRSFNALAKSALNRLHDFPRGVFQIVRGDHVQA